MTSLAIVLILSFAIVVEVIGTISLKLADGFRKLLPTLVAIISYVVAFYCMSLVLRVLPIGIVYAVWSGLGTVFVVLIGRYFFKQRIHPVAIVGIFLIILGVVFINIASVDI